LVGSIPIAGFHDCVGEEVEGDDRGGRPVAHVPQTPEGDTAADLRDWDTGRKEPPEHSQVRGGFPQASELQDFLFFDGTISIISRMMLLGRYSFKCFLRRFSFGILSLLRSANWSAR
jgi:hypothetical protein